MSEYLEFIASSDWVFPKNKRDSSPDTPHARRQNATTANRMIALQTMNWVPSAGF